MMKKNNLSCCSTSESPIIDDIMTDQKVCVLWYKSENNNPKKIFFTELYFWKLLNRNKIQLD